MKNMALKYVIIKKIGMERLKKYIRKKYRKLLINELK